MKADEAARPVDVDLMGAARVGGVPKHIQQAGGVARTASAAMAEGSLRTDPRRTVLTTRCTGSKDPAACGASRGVYRDVRIRKNLGGLSRDRISHKKASALGRQEDLG